MNRMKIIVSAGGLIFIIICVILIVNTIKSVKNEASLIYRDLSGVIVGLKDINHGFFIMQIKRHNPTDTLEYRMPVGWFIKQKNITLGDSISKGVGSNIINFYKMENDVYVKCCELTYY